MQVLNIEVVTAFNFSGHAYYIFISLFITKKLLWITLVKAVTLSYILDNKRTGETEKLIQQKTVNKFSRKLNIINSSKNNIPIQSKSKKKRLKDTPKINKNDDEMSKQIGTKTNDKRQTKFSFKKKCVYSDHHGSANFHIGFENQGTYICFFNLLMQVLFFYLLSKTIFNKVSIIIK